MTTFIYSAETRTPTERRPVSNPVTLYGVDAPFTELRDPALNVQQVKDTLVPNKTAQGWTSNVPTLVVTGTAIAGGVTEAEIVTGGETLIFTLTNGTWPADVLEQLEAGLDGSDSGGTGWDDEVVHDWASDGARTNDVTITLTLPAAGDYAIGADETVTFEIPAALVLVNGQPITNSGNLTASPANFVVTAA